MADDLDDAVRSLYRITTRLEELENTRRQLQTAKLTFQLTISSTSLLATKRLARNWLISQEEPKEQPRVIVVEEVQKLNNENKSLRNRVGSLERLSLRYYTEHKDRSTGNHCPCGMCELYRQLTHTK